MRAARLDPRFTTAGARFETVCELGHGGMGTVTLCRMIGAAGFAKLVVQKRLHRYLANDELTVKRFLLEAKIAAHVHHANVVGIQRVGRDDDGYYLVFDYVEGDSLQGLVDRAQRRGERVPTRVLVRVLLDVLAGLHAAHETTDDEGRPLEILHRDATPQNVLVGLDGTARLADFGVARSSRMPLTGDTGALVGKVLYMAPEYLRRDAVDRRLDIYSMGLTAWVALAGARPWGSTNEGGLVLKIVSDGVPSLSTARPDLPAELVAVIDRACRKDAAGRFATAREMAQALEAAATTAGLVASHREVADHLEGALGGELSSRRRQTVASPAVDQEDAAFVARVTRAASRRPPPRSPASRASTARSGAKLFAIVATAAIVAFGSASLRGLATRADAAQRSQTSEEDRRAMAARGVLAVTPPGPTASARVAGEPPPASSAIEAASRSSHRRVAD